MNLNSWGGLPIDAAPYKPRYAEAVGADAFRKPFPRCSQERRLDTSLAGTPHRWRLTQVSTSRDSC